MSKTEVPPNNAALTDLAERINTEHEACHASMQRGLEHALKAGGLLLEAKAGLPHGEWLPWLGENCPDISERTAQNYMRLARELPKLEPEKAQRVADLSYRDAVRVLTQNLSAIAKAEPKAQDIIVAALEVGKSLPQARREAAKATALPVDHVPESLKPEPDKRRVGILTNGGKNEVCVVIGPNQAGLDLKTNLQAARKKDADVQAWEQNIAAKQRRAKKLCEEADQLEAEARDDKRELDESLYLDLTELHGPALHYVETWDYALDDEQWAELQHKRCPEDAAAYVSEVGVLKQRGWWGDITVQTYSANGPVHSDPVGGNGWNGWGSSDWLDEFFPDGLAPKHSEEGI